MLELSECAQDTSLFSFSQDCFISGNVFPNEDSHGSFSFEDTSFSYMSYSGLYRIDLVTHVIAESKAIEPEVTAAVHVTFPKQYDF